MYKTNLSRVMIAVLMLALLAGSAFAQTTKVNKLTVGSTAFSTGKINLAPATNAAGGIYFGNDVTLYRSAANVLKTDDSLTVTGTLTTGTLAFTTQTTSGAATFNGDVTLGNAVGDVVTITGTPTFAQTVTMSGAATVGTTLGVTGTASLNGAVNVGDAVGDVITVNGTPTFKEAVVCEKTLGVTGAATLGAAATVGTTLGVTGATTLTGDLTANGNTTLGNASTDTITNVGRLIVRSVNDDTMDATAGTQGEIVYNIQDNKFYGCTNTGTPATWAAFH